MIQKVFVIVPTKDKTFEDIQTSIQGVKKLVKDLKAFPDDATVEFIDTTSLDALYKGVNDIYKLGKLLELMSSADLVVTTFPTNDYDLNIEEPELLSKLLVSVAIVCNMPVWFL